MSHVFERNPVFDPLFRLFLVIFSGLVNYWGLDEWDFWEPFCFLVLVVSFVWGRDKTGDQSKLYLCSN